MTNTQRALKILFAEDNIDHSEIIMDALAEFNVFNEVKHVPDGEQLLRYLFKEPPFDGPESWRPDLILLDLKMPKLDGLSVLEKLKEDDRIKDIPVIVITTSNNPQEIKESYKLGASSFITKPFRFEEFSRKIRDLNMYWVLTTELPPRQQA